jgi:hypothetical protein
MDRDKLNLEIARLQQLVKALTFASVKDDKKGRMVQAFEAALGFTETVLTIVRTSREAISARDVRDRLNDLGYDLSKYANPLAFVHSVLGRLVEQEKIRQIAPGSYTFNDALYPGLLVTCPYEEAKPPENAAPRAYCSATVESAFEESMNHIFGLGCSSDQSGVALGRTSTSKGKAASRLWDDHSGRCSVCGTEHSQPKIGPNAVAPPPKMSDVEKSGKR